MKVKTADITKYRRDYMRVYRKTHKEQTYDQTACWVDVVQHNPSKSEEKPYPGSEYLGGFVNLHLWPFEDPDNLRSQPAKGTVLQIGEGSNEIVNCYRYDKVDYARVGIQYNHSGHHKPGDSHRGFINAQRGHRTDKPFHSNLHRNGLLNSVPRKEHSR